MGMIINPSAFSSGVSDSWTPHELAADILAWMDANSGVSTSGSNVTSWASRESGPTIGVNSSTPETRTIGGYPSVSTGPGDTMSGTITLGGTEATVIFCGTQRSASASFGRLVSLGNSGQASDANSTARACLARDGTTGNVFVASNSLSGASYPVGHNVVFIAVMQCTGSAITLHVNGTSAGSIAVANSFSVNKLGIRHQANNTNASEQSQGDTLEVIVLDRVLTSTEREKVEGYLAHRYNIATNLASGHSYRDNAPTISGATGSARPSTSPTSRYWRIRSTDTNIANDYMACMELELRETSGGADTTSGMTISASAAHASFPIGNAIDNNTTTFWTSGNTFPSGGNWMLIDFGAGNEKSINEVTYKVRSDAFREDPNNLFIERSSDGTDFFPEWRQLAIGTWTAGETKTFTRP